MEAYGALDDLLHWPILAKLGLDRLQTITRAHVQHDSKLAYIVDRDDDVYRIQENTVKITELSGQKICAFVIGNSRHFALSKDGDLYSWLCSSNDTPTILKTNVVRLETGHIRIDSNDYHTVALAVDGVGWGWKTDITYVRSGKHSRQQTNESCVDINLTATVQASESVSDIVYRSDPKLAVDRPVVRVERLNDYCLLALADDGRIFVRNSYNSNKPEFRVCEDSCYKPVRFADIAVVQKKLLAVSTDGLIYLGNDSDTSELTSTGERNINNVLANNGLGTHKTIVVYNNSDTLSQAFGNKSFSDCLFSVGGQKIYAPKMLLRMKSDYFKTMFDGEWKESRDNEQITITKHSYTVYKSLLRYLCTGGLVVEDCDLIRLMQLAHETMHEILIEICVQKLRYKLSVQTIIDVYMVAKTLDLSLLLRYCKQFTNIYMKEIVEAELAKRPEQTTQLLTFATVKKEVEVEAEKVEKTDP